MRNPARRTLLTLAAAVMTTAVAGVGSASLSSAAPPPRASATAAADGQADWTLMIYDVADTPSIAEDMIRNLAAFTRLPAMSNVNIVAMVDLPERNDEGYPVATLPGIAPFTTTKLVVLDGGRWNEVRDLGEKAMGRPDVLAGFIEEAADLFPADKYGLVLSDHGAGYFGALLDTGPPGTSRMSVDDLRNGILTGMQRAGIDRFEMIDHDSCLMASYEAASALGPLTRTLVASEEVTFGDNTLTSEAMATLGQNASGVDFGNTNIEEYAAWADAVSPEYGDFSALSVVDGEQMARLDAAVESFADVAIAHMDEIAPEIGKARAKSLEFLVRVVGEDQSDDIIDLGDFLRHLRDVPPEVQVARDAVFAALDATVVTQVTRQATQQATGLNVFLPKQGIEARDYLDGRWGPPGWSRFVKAYAEAGAQAAEGSATFVSDKARVAEKGKGGIRIAAQLATGAEKNVTNSETQVFTKLEGRDVLAVALPAYLNSGGVGQVQGVWDYAVTAVTDGRTTLPVSAVYQAQSGGLIGSFWVDYRTPAGAVTTLVVRVLLDSDGTVLGISLADSSSDGSGGVTLQNGGVITPHLIVKSSDGFTTVRSSRTIRVSNDLTVGYPQFRAGTRFEMGVVVADLAGGSDAAFVSETVPKGRTR